MVEYPYYLQPEKKRIPLKLVIGILVVVIIMVIAYFSVQPSAPAKVSAVSKNISVEKNLAVTAIFASSIDSNFNYKIQPGAEYLQNSGVYIYVEVTNFVQKNLAVDVTEDLEIKDSAGETVFAKKDFGSLNTSYSKTIDTVKFNNAIPTLGWKIGTYIATIIVNDKFAGSSATKTVEFTLVEKPTAVIQKTVDLSKIVSAKINQTQLIRQQTVWGPNGSIVPELTFNQTFSGDLNKSDLSNIDSSFKIPERFDSGRYTVEIKYVNLQNGLFTSVKDTVTVTRQFSISKLVFASSIDSDYNYVAQPNAAFANGDNLYIYMELSGFTQQLNVGGNYAVSFAEDIQTTDPDGNTVQTLSKENYLEVSQAFPLKSDIYRIKNELVTGIGLKNGLYTVKITITDRISGTKTTKEASFTLI